MSHFLLFLSSCERVIPPTPQKQLQPASFAENANLVALRRIESIRFALFQFTDFNQKYAAAYQCFV